VLHAHWSLFIKRGRRTPRKTIYWLIKPLPLPQPPIIVGPKRKTMRPYACRNRCPPRHLQIFPLWLILVPKGQSNACLQILIWETPLNLRRAVSHSLIASSWCYIFERLLQWCFLSIDSSILSKRVIIRQIIGRSAIVECFNILVSFNCSIYLVMIICTWDLWPAGFISYTASYLKLYLWCIKNIFKKTFLQKLIYYRLK